jgi:hypothetical protein
MPRHKANAEPAGGGGGGWAEFNRKAAERRAQRTRAVGTQEWVKEKIAEGDIAGGMASGQSGTSIFDPVLCELAYRWFCPPGGLVLDPFAGGSVRGVVASRLGRRYLGIDLRPEQVEANQHQADMICRPGDPRPEWLIGDSRERLAEIADLNSVTDQPGTDFIFSCPPYADLEVYSDDPRDLSTMPWPEFRAAYGEIIGKAAALLRDDRFACFVVGEVRSKSGGYYGFVPATIAAFEQAGLAFYNEMILVTAAGSLPIRAGKQFESSRKVGKTHQQVLIFVRGDPRKATQAVGPVEFGTLDGEDEYELVADGTEE